MTIEPGTRVRSTEKIPNLTTGTYIFKGNFFHRIHWDGREDDWVDLHTESEFEVIDE